MAKPEKRIKQKIGSYFLGCLGFSGKKTQKSIVLGNGERKKKDRWCSWSRFRMKNGEIRTVPVDASTERFNSSSKAKSNKRDPVMVSDLAYHHGRRENIPGSEKPVSGQGAEQETRETTNEPAADIVLEKSTAMDHLNPPKDATCQQRVCQSVRRILDATKTGSTLPYLSDRKPGSKPTRPVWLPHSISLPATKDTRKPSRATAGNLRRRRDEIGSPVRNFDPIIGMSIVMLTLGIMLLWGRLCAILCTSAWCYFLPRLRNKSVSKRDRSCAAGNESDSAEPDLSSDAYKMRVVLQGFLERKHRVSF